MKWHEARSPARDEQLAAFIGLCDRGLAAMKAVAPANDGERQDLADFQRNCGRRHGFAVTLRDRGEAACEQLIRETIEREEAQLAGNP